MRLSPLDGAAMGGLIILTPDWMSIEFRYIDNWMGKTDPWIRFKDHGRMAYRYI